MKRFLLISCCVLFPMSLTLAACNTVEGAGKDVEAVGESVQDAAN
ncbi:entericidin A/B family lipoprotein [Asticcacaulis sp. AC402]|nr:entericidin A/B family lipoprotein [Asticcacaulis sp. AC402]ESQ75657.1 hypothetical protein ABAC402_09020 [Asticcacaulis sp. AC402]